MSVGVKTLPIRSGTVHESVTCRVYIRLRKMTLRKLLNDSKILDKVYEHCLKNAEAVFDLGIHANIQFATMAEYIEEEREKLNGRADYTEDDDGHTDS